MAHQEITSAVLRDAAAAQEALDETTATLSLLARDRAEKFTLYTQALADLADEEPRAGSTKVAELELLRKQHRSDYVAKLVEIRDAYAGELKAAVERARREAEKKRAADVGRLENALKSIQADLKATRTAITEDERELERCKGAREKWIRRNAELEKDLRSTTRELERKYTERDELIETLEATRAATLRLHEQNVELMEHSQRIYNRIRLYEIYMDDNASDATPLRAARLFIEDLLRHEGDPAAAAVAVQYQLWKHLRELRYLFRFYSVYRRVDREKLQSPFRLSVDMSNFAVFLHDHCKLNTRTNSRLTPTKSDQIFLKAIAPRVSSGKGEEKCARFSEFCEAIVRCAAIVYDGESHLGVMVENFLVNDILPFAKVGAGLHHREHIQELRVVPNVLSAFQESLIELYDFYAKMDQSTDHAQAHERSINVVEFVQMMVDLGFIDRTFTINGAVVLFAQSQSTEDAEKSEGHSDDDWFFNTEMSFGDFLESLTRLSMQRMGEGNLDDVDLVTDKFVRSVVLKAWAVLKEGGTNSPASAGSPRGFRSPRRASVERRGSSSSIGSPGSTGGAASPRRVRRVQRSQHGASDGNTSLSSQVERMAVSKGKR